MDLSPHPGPSPVCGAGPRPAAASQAALLTVTTMLLTACGYIGPPLPPALNIPSPADDLRAIEYGPNLLVQFTVPATTTDDLPLTRIRSVDLYIGPAQQPFDAGAWAAGAEHYLIDAEPAGMVHHEVPARTWVGQQVTIGVRTTGPTGRVSDWSPFKILNVNPPLAQPAAVTPSSVEAGVSLSWTGAAPGYRILRAVGDAELTLLAQSDMPAYLDPTTVYGTRYTYVVIGVAGDMQQSLPSDPAAITPSDTFPPAIPMGLSAVPGPQSVELAWQRNTEPDFLGYNIFRSVDGGPFTMIPVQLDAPVYSDTDVSSGHRYSYTVAAVDTSNNVSDRSQAVEVAIP